MGEILHIRIEHTSAFLKTIEVIKDLLPETNIIFSSDRPDEEIDGESDNEEDNESGEDDEDDEEYESDDEDNPKTPKKICYMKIVAIDTTKTVLINLKLDGNKFAKFVCRRRELILGVNLGYFYKLIKSIDKDSHMILSVDENEVNHLKINISNGNNSKITNYRLKLLDLKHEELQLPRSDFEAEVIINSDDFHKECREMKQNADNVEIKCSKKKLTLSFEGDYSDGSVEYFNDDGTGGESDEIILDERKRINIRFAHKKNKKSPSVIQGIYELKHLVLFSKCTSLCKEIKIFMKNDFALIIQYNVATYGRLLLCISPIKLDGMDDSDDEDYYNDDNDVEMIE